MSLLNQPINNNLNLYPSIHFQKSEKGLQVTIETERLFLRSIRLSDADFMQTLFQDSLVMKKIYDGTSFSSDTINRIVAKRVSLWEKSNPFSGLCVFKKDNKSLEGEFIGYCALTKTDKEKEVELHYLSLPSYWGQKFGSEIAVVVFDYPLALKEHGYPIEVLTAKAKADNISNRLIQKLGFHLVIRARNHGAMRHFYKLEVKELPYVLIRKFYLNKLLSNSNKLL
jgi:RimJ/RimL family protein N-acetyltransferase